jgi:hypothetical protein
LTTLAGGKLGKADEKWRKIDQKTGVGSSGNTPYFGFLISRKMHKPSLGIPFTIPYGYVTGNIVINAVTILAKRAIDTAGHQTGNSYALGELTFPAIKNHEFIISLLE